MPGANAYEQRIQTICLLILTALALAGAMHLFRTVLIPFVLAIFLTYCLTPLIDVQVRRMKLPRFVALANSIVLGVLVLILVGLLISSAVFEVSANVDTYKGQIRQLVERVVNWEPLGYVGLDAEGAEEQLLRIPGEAVGTLVSGAVSGVMSVISNARWSSSS